MAKFLYDARDKSGRSISGEMEAETAAEVESKLQSNGLSSVNVRKKPMEIHIKLPFGNKVTAKDLKTFTQQFSTMVDAGLPLVQCLDILGSQSDNKYFGQVLIEIKGYVEGGATFSDALAKYPNIFDSLFVNLVAAGELGGILDTIMKRLAEYIEKKEQLQRKVKGAMVYPTAILIITAVIITILLKWVIPTFEKMFSDFGKEGELPAPTQFVIGLSRAFQDWWYIFGIVIVVVVTAYRMFVKTPVGRQTMDRIFLSLPIVGSVVQKIAVARFTRTLGTLLSSGVPIIDALNTVAKAAGNSVVEKAVLFARDRISEGRNMSEPLQDAKIFPGMVVQMIAVGEQTGALDIMCNKIADFYDEEVDVAVAALTSMLEPLMMVVIGGVVGGMVIAMYLPIFSIAGTVE
ncbi:MAG: type II secretion system F family protein [Deltaproteobacteria bacterium]|nr:type II secretion system F family protein [Deltaproteobacteria bacterium]MBN2673220.1 type II secretion system F family protein [Deltaproteobacteria bacterium]